jgi:hypothetical protein
MLKRGVTVACVTMVALTIPTPALAAEAGGAAAVAGQTQAAGICDIVPLFWWCKK